MKHNRTARIVVAVLFLIGFAFYSYKISSIRMHSADVAAWGEAVGLHPEGYGEAVKVTEVTNPPEETAAPAETAAAEESAAPTEAPSAETANLPAVDITSWELMLVNTEHPLDREYAPPEVVNVSESQCPQDSRIVDALTQFADAAKAEGLPVYLSSGYRSYNEQSSSFQTKVNQVGSNEEAAKIVAFPGTSEHQTGLCCDITDIYRNPKTIEVCEATDTYQWMSKHCQEYGFIVRYPDGKQEITGIMYEPWHFRYVGVEAATYIMENDLCLEEFIALYDTGSPEA